MKHFKFKTQAADRKEKKKNLSEYIYIYIYMGVEYCVQKRKWEKESEKSGKTDLWLHKIMSICENERKKIYWCLSKRRKRKSIREECIQGQKRGWEKTKI